METWKLVLAIATAIGAVVTIYGLVAAFLAARRDYFDAGERIYLSKYLADEEKRMHAWWGAVHGQDGERVNREYNQIYADLGLLRPSMGESPYLSAHEGRRLLGIILNSTRDNLLLAGAGLVLSAGASIVSIFVL